MSFSGRFERVFRALIPGPFSLAVALTFGVLAVAVVGFVPPEETLPSHGQRILRSWYFGLWDPPMLVFAFQMMLILVLGHVLALSRPADKLMRRFTARASSTASAAALVCAVCVVLGFLNWGLALIFGAVLARKIAEASAAEGRKLNYPLIAAAGYTGMMVWHGGLSGSALIKASEPGHLTALMAGSTQVQAARIPAEIPLSETVFSPMNLAVSAALLTVLPAIGYLAGKRRTGAIPEVSPINLSLDIRAPEGLAEKTEHHYLPAFLLGALALITAALLGFSKGDSGSYGGPDFINLIFLGLGLTAHGSLHRFAAAVRSAVTGTAGILIQFPLYFGIMAVLKSSGMGAAISDFFVAVSTPDTYRILTFFSAGFINILVPSGGGQWMIQGPIIIDASQKMGLALPQSILAMAYGDQITNMLQPFWALPLLGITGLKARDILPYTLYFMAGGIAIFITALIIFRA